MTFDELLDKLAGKSITVNLPEGKLSMSQSDLAGELKGMMISLKQDCPELREMLIDYAWDLAAQAGSDIDHCRCPGCPHRGKGILFTMGDADVICDTPCPSKSVTVVI